MRVPPNEQGGADVIGGNVPTDDAELARRAADGDAAAFAALYDRYFRNVYRYVFARVRDRDEAEDVTSDVFFRALRALRRYEPRTAFLAWLFRIARNAVIDLARERRRLADHALELLPHPASREAADPEEASVASDRARRVRVALGALTDIQREVVLLRFFDGLSTHEICAVVGKGPSTVRGIQHRALLALRAVVSEEEFR